MKTIREEIVNATTFLYDVDTEDYDALLVTWSNSSASTGQPTSVILCPTIERHGGANMVTDDLSNFPGVPAPPNPNHCSYASLGLSCMIPTPLPPVVTVGVICPAGVICSLRVIGQFRPNPLESPVPLRRSHS